jgi:YD repeat-containing protein
MKKHFPSSLLRPMAVCAVFLVLSAGGGTINYAYDPAGRMISAAYNASASVSYSYDPSGNLLIASGPAPGLILSPVAAGQFTLSWPVSPGGFTLQKTGTLGPAAAWTAVNTTPAQVGNMLVVTIPIGSGAVFYRLLH